MRKPPEKKKNTALIMLAAGNSRRFGANKLLYEINGVPMYERTLSCLLKVQEEVLKATGTFCPVTVVTQYQEIGEAAEKRGQTCVIILILRKAFLLL